ncbi:hypothetical protein [Streptomyces sp. NPDC001914]|uniref:hypothetical protein n=1 Tax=Streptomyces sp. NPDC001914 TaxID=3364623 RepID=UPI00367DAECF
MDTLETVSAGKGEPVPQQLRVLFNRPDDVKVQKLPCALPDEDSLAEHFAAGSRTVPHTHHNGQHLVIMDSVGVVADDTGVHVVRAWDLLSSPPGGWHWHGAAPDSATTHVTVEQPGDFDLAVERRDRDTAYAPEHGT